ncbi:V-type ATP synthase subunit I [Candidatus Woesearchaeota archaeon]|nr:V-type ATP synthase subunit I [Candidatus Woesearchaeota archaeon]
MAFRPELMSKVTIAGPKQYMEACISELHKLKAIHIVDHTKDADADIGKPMAKASGLSEALVRIRSICSWLGIKNGKEHTVKSAKEAQKLGHLISSLFHEVKGLLEQSKEIDSKINDNNLLISELRPLADTGLKMEFFSEYRSIAYFAGYTNDAKALAESIKKITGTFSIYGSQNGEGAVAIFIDSKSRDKCAEALREQKFQEINIEKLRQFRGTPNEIISGLERENGGLNAKKEKTHSRFSEIREEHSEELLRAMDFLEKEVEKAEAPLRFAETKSSFVVKGWIPSKNVQTAEEVIAAKTGNRIFFHAGSPEKKDDVPVKLNNPKAVSPFEFFMDLYTMPSYKEIDPTFFIFLSFPILFGFMLGDFGYGLATLALFIMLRKIMPQAKNFFNILIVSSLSTIFFGLLFGEFFGFEEIGHFTLPHILSRSHQIEELLYIAVAIGFIHVNIGLLVGFANEMKSHGFRHAFLAKLSWLVFEAGLVMVFLSMLGIISLSYWFGVGVVLLSAALLFIGEGARGPIEMPGLISNMLSYARLMAIGVSSVKLAEVINEMSGKMFHAGGVMIIVGVLILVFGHAVNIGLGLLGSFLHSLRLHYVEFFTKFFHGGAKKFAPFGEKK